MIDRRTLLTGLGALIAAPAIVRASSLMPIKALPPTGEWYEVTWMTSMLEPLDGRLLANAKHLLIRNNVPIENLIIHSTRRIDLIGSPWQFSVEGQARY